MTVRIFTTNSCAYCGMVKKYLMSKGVSYDEINLNDHPEFQQEATALSGAMTVPVTVVTKESNEQVIVGWNPGRLASAIA